MVWVSFLSPLGVAACVYCKSAIVSMDDMDGLADATLPAERGWAWVCHDWYSKLLQGNG